LRGDVSQDKGEDGEQRTLRERGASKKRRKKKGQDFTAA